MFEINKAGETLAKLARDAVGQVVVEATNLVETTTKETDELGKFLGSLGKVKSPEEAGNLFIAYNTQFFQRSTTAFTKAVERGQVYQAFARKEFEKAAKA